MAVKSFNFTKPAKFYTSTNLSHLNIEIYYQEDQLSIWYKSQKSPQIHVTEFDYLGLFGFLECLGWWGGWETIDPRKHFRYDTENMPRAEGSQ